MFQRIRIKATERTCRDTRDIGNFQEVLYADDARLISPTTKSMNINLALVEQESGRLGLKLNKKESKVICTTRRSYIQFQNTDIVALGGIFGSPDKH